MDKYTYKGCTLFLSSFEQVLEDMVSAVDVVVVSPPYNIGSKCPKKIGGRKLGKYDAKSWGAIEGYEDSMPEDDYQKSQVDFLRLCESKLSPNGLIIYNHKPRHKNGVLIKPEEWLNVLVKEKTLVYRDEIVWDRGSTHNHCSSYVFPQSERIYVLCKPNSKPYFNNCDFYWNPKNKGVGDVWRIPPEKGSFHNAPFPLKLARQCIKMWCPPNGLVVDPCSGSGTTMIASIYEGKRFIGSEKLEKYFKKAVTRIKNEFSPIFNVDSKTKKTEISNNEVCARIL